MLSNLSFKLSNYFRKNILAFFITLIIGTNLHATNYYVNDVSTFGDIYTSTSGADINDGKSPNSPKLTLLAAYNIASTGDIIYVDTGDYPKNDTIDLIISNNLKKIQIIRADADTTIYQRKPYPYNQKVSPAIFYISNDKPIEREVYMQQLQNTAIKTKDK